MLVHYQPLYNYHKRFGFNQMITITVEFRALSVRYSFTSNEKSVRAGVVTIVWVPDNLPLLHCRLSIYSNNALATKRISLFLNHSQVSIHILKKKSIHHPSIILETTIQQNRDGWGILSKMKKKNINFNN